jgi:hypothetical protein
MQYLTFIPKSSGQLCKFNRSFPDKTGVTTMCSAANKAYLSGRFPDFERPPANSAGLCEEKAFPRFSGGNISVDEVA